MKIVDSIKESVESDPNSQWALLAGTLGEAIIQRALSMSVDELREFIASTEAGKRIADASTDERLLAIAAGMVGTALL